MTTEIAYRIRTKAKDASGRPIKVESVSKAYVERRLIEIQAQDPNARILGIPVNGR